MVKVALIGCGYWGINYARLLNELSEAELAVICDPQVERLKLAKKKFPFTRVTTRLEEALDDEGLQAAVVATPVALHHQVGKVVLLRGKHLLMEKPLCPSLTQAQELVELARTANKVLMVGHTFLFNPGIRAMKRYLASEDFGTTYYLHATRTHLGLLRQDVNAIWDLAPHDISIFNYLLSSEPQWVAAQGGRYLGGRHEDVGFITLGYPGGVMGHIHVSWLNSNKVREVVAVGSRARIVFDDLNNLERIKIFKKGAEVTGEVDSYGEFQLALRDGDIISPKLEVGEPLKEQCQEFLRCIAEDTRPLSDGAFGVGVIRVLKAVDLSLARGGAPVELARDLREAA